MVEEVTWKKRLADEEGQCHAFGHNFSISLDGFGTGEGQSLESPFGHAGYRLHEWLDPTRTFQELQGRAGRTGIDDAFACSWASGIGAEIMGRNKFGPQRGPWADEDWKGWWGDDPPFFHTPVFILSHHLRPPDRDEGRNHVPLHRREPRRGPGSGPASGRRLGRTDWRGADNGS